jgi:hypothetical protein
MRDDGFERPRRRLTPFRLPPPLHSNDEWAAPESTFGTVRIRAERRQL